MIKEKILERILANKAIAVIRLDKEEKVLPVVLAIAEGGVTIVEITFTTPNAPGIIKSLSSRENILVGAGTVLSEEEANLAMDSGAQFLVTPILKPQFVRVAHDAKIPIMMGAMTPTEIYTAWECGADVVKVFPADVVGTSFFKSVRGPFPNIKMMPTGGVTLSNAGDWLKAGACAVGIGSALLNPKSIAENRFEDLTESAKIFRSSIDDYVKQSIQ